MSDLEMLGIYVAGSQSASECVQQCTECDCDCIPGDPDCQCECVQHDCGECQCEQ